MRIAWLLLCGSALAQDQTGGVSGVVVDAVTKMPVKKTVISADAIGRPASPVRGGGTTTDASGAFNITGISPGKTRLIFVNQNYPQARFGGLTKTIDIKAGETAGPLTVELMPGAAVSGRIVDEDGDPLPTCNVQLHSSNDPEVGVNMSGSFPSNQDGEWRIFGVAAGKYFLSAQCGMQVFQARPLSSGADPPPSRAYPQIYYPGVLDPKSAQILELAAGAEKSGVDIMMAPTAVTQVHGAFTPGSADWHGNLAVQLNSDRQRNGNVGTSVNQQKGTFDFQRVFPGSYTLVIFSNNGAEEKRAGAWQKVEVGDKPVHLAVELRPAMDLSGRMEIDSSSNSTNKLTTNQVNISLSPPSRVGMPASQAQVEADGSFVLKGVLPGPWILKVNAPNAYLKEAWLGGTDVTNTMMDLSSGAAGALRIVVSTNTSTIKGSAPLGQVIFARFVQDLSPGNARAAMADQNGQYVFSGLAPGKYRLFTVESGTPPPAEGGLEVNVREGETALIDLKP